MKTNNMISTILKAVTFVAVAFGMTNCSKSNNNNGYYGVPNGYRMVNNTCYQTTNGVSVPVGNPQTCMQMNAPMYQMGTNGMCYQIINGQQIQQPNQLACSTNGTSAYGVCSYNPYGQQGYNPYGTSNPYGTYNPYGQQGCNSAYGGVMTQVCTGPYTDGSQWVNCGTQMNCSGYTLYNQAMQPVHCQ